MVYIYLHLPYIPVPWILWEMRKKVLVVRSVRRKQNRMARKALGDLRVVVGVDFVWCRHIPDDSK